MEKILAEKYGIRSEKELMDAYRKMPKLDIGIFTQPIPKNSNIGISNVSDGIKRTNSGRSETVAVLV